MYQIVSLPNHSIHFIWIPVQKKKEIDILVVQQVAASHYVILVGREYGIHGYSNMNEGG